MISAVLVAGVLGFAAGALAEWRAGRRYRRWCWLLMVVAGGAMGLFLSAPGWFVGSSALQTAAAGAFGFGFGALAGELGLLLAGTLPGRQGKRRDGSSGR